jgi:hypothetical protein
MGEKADLPTRLKEHKTILHIYLTGKNVFCTPGISDDLLLTSF